MPELPEVETVLRGLRPALIGRSIVAAEVRSFKTFRPHGALSAEDLVGARVEAMRRRGKLLLWDLSGGRSLVFHFKMTGQFVFPGNGKHSRVSFRFADGTLLDFNDNRLFAELRLVDDWKKLAFVRELGPDPFEISDAQFRQMLSKKGTKIKPLLMDQSFIAGIGNIYAAEMLFDSRISPARPASSLSDREKGRLYQAMKDVLNAAIRAKGSSVDNYVQLDGHEGGFVPHLKVYGREGKPCEGCRGTVKRTTLGGRGTYFCPSCQK